MTFCPFIHFTPYFCSLFPNGDSYDCIDSLYYIDCKDE